jgi:hypothetical protein
MKMISELRRTRQGSNQQFVAARPGRSVAQHFASRAVAKAVQLNRLPSRAVGQLRSSRSFVHHRGGTCVAIRCGSSVHAARIRPGSSHSAAKTSRARRQSNNALVPTANRLAPVGPHRAYAAPAAQRRRWARSEGKPWHKA